jgi:hypothetical protein
MSKVSIGANTFVYPMPDNSYWTVGDYAGKAWGLGKEYKK